MTIYALDAWMRRVVKRGLYYIGFGKAVIETVIASGRSARCTQGLTVVCFGILRLDYGGT